MDDRYSRELRTLVDDHYHGLSTFDSYRHRRAELLDALENEEAGTDAGRPSNERESDERTSSVFRGLDADRAPHTRSRPMRILAVLSIGLLGLVTAGDIGGPEIEIESRADTAVAAGLLDRFLARDDWGPESLSNFRLAWDALPAGEREVARASDQFLRFEGELRKRLQQNGNADSSSGVRELARAMDMPPEDVSESTPPRQGP